MSHYEKLYNNICRLCLSHYKSENMIPLLNNLSSLSPYGQAVLKFANISIKPDDNLPNKMCTKCLYLLRQAAIFKLNCESSDRQLKILKYYSKFGQSLKENIVQYWMYKLYFPTESANGFSKITYLLSKNKENKTAKTGQSKENKHFDNIKVPCKSIDPNESSKLADNEFKTHDNNCDQNPHTTTDTALPTIQNDDQLLDIMEKMIGTHSEILNNDFKQCKKIRMLRRRKLLRHNQRQSKADKINGNKHKTSLECRLCYKVLANQFTYKQHMQRHNGCRYICEHCGKGFPVRTELNIHSVARHGTGPYLQCQHCSFKAPRRFDLIEHERTHTGERPYTCDKCGLTFRRRGIWRKHLIYHSEKKVQCSQCPRKFYLRSEMLAHANNVHDRIYVYLCSKCGATYAKPATVRRHLTERHGIPRELQGKVIRVNKSSGCHK